jgi:uncharacterized protein
MTPDFSRGDKLVKKQILILNKHLPRKRKFLEELLKEDKPHVVGADGVRHRFKREELERISGIIGKSNFNKLKLPIYIEIDSNASGSRIAGKYESEVVCKILEIDNCETEMYIYRADLKKLRSILPTTTQYIFLVR